MLVLYAEQDPLTPLSWTERAIGRACQMKDQITIRQVPQPSLDPDALEWIGTRLREEPVPDDCASFVAAHPPAQDRRRRCPGRHAGPDHPAETAGNVETPPQTREVSLISGWLPVTIQVLTALALIAATGWRSRPWTGAGCRSRRRRASR